MRTLFTLVAGSALVLGCGGSAPPPAEQPEPAALEEPLSAAEPTPEPVAPADPGAEQESAVAPVAAQSDNSVPDDYTLLHGDCVELSKRFTALTRSEQGAALSPRLTPQQRADTEKRIDVVAAKMGERYLVACEKNVGNSVDPKSLKCAFDARTVKTFDQCLNGEAPPR